MFGLKVPWIRPLVSLMSVESVKMKMGMDFDKITRYGKTYARVILSTKHFIGTGLELNR